MTGKYRYAVLAFIPFILLCVFLAHTASDLPDSNQWNMVPLLEKWYAGTLTLPDLFRREGEHILFFPWLILLAVAAVTHWNLYYEVAVNLFLGTGICALFFYQIRKMEVYFKQQANATYFLVSLFVFSVAQSNNWYCGQVAPFLSILSFTAGVIILSSPAFGIREFIYALAAGVIATFSFGNGLLFWPIGFLLLSVRPLNRKAAVLVPWAAIFTLITAGYLWGYQKPAQHPSILFIAQHPLRAAEYFLVFLGSALLPFERFTSIIFFFGLFCLTAFVFVAYHSYRAARKDPAALLMLLPWFALASFSIASAALATVARAGFGVAQATASRYVTTSNILWVSVIILFPIAAQSFLRARSGLLADLARSRLLKYTCLLVFFVLQISVIKQKWFWEKVRKDELADIGNALRAGNYNEEKVNARIYNSIGSIHDRVIYLKQHHLALFRAETEDGTSAVKLPSSKYR